MDGSSELEVINEIKSVVQSLTLWFGITVWKWIRWIFVMRSFRVVKRFLGKKIGNKLTSEEHVEGLCRKARQKISAVARISSLIRFEQRKPHLTFHFSYCPLVWIFNSRRLDNRIDHIHEKALRVIYQDYNSSFKELLRKYSSLTKTF